MIRTLIQSRCARWAAVPALFSVGAAVALAVCPPPPPGTGVGCGYPNSPPVAQVVPQPKPAPTSLAQEIVELKRICAQQQQSLQQINALLSSLLTEVQALRQAVAPPQLIHPLVPPPIRPETPPPVPLGPYYQPPSRPMPSPNVCPPATPPMGSTSAAPAHGPYTVVRPDGTSVQMPLVYTAPPAPMPSTPVPPPGLAPDENPGRAKPFRPTPPTCTPATSLTPDRAQMFSFYLGLFR